MDPSNRYPSETGRNTRNGTGDTSYESRRSGHITSSRRSNWRKRRGRFDDRFSRCSAGSQRSSAESRRHNQTSDRTTQEYRYRQDHPEQSSHPMSKALVSSEFIRGVDGTFFTNTPLDVIRAKWKPVRFIEEILKDPDIDIDDDIREAYRPIAYELLVGDGMAKFNQSEFERANPEYSKPGRGTIFVNHFGDSDDETVTVVNTETDTRYLRMDRYGKYYGRDEGAIRKTTMNHRQRCITVIEAEMQRAQDEKDMWSFLSLEQQQEASRRGLRTRFGARADFVPLGLEDIEESEMAPEVGRAQAAHAAAAKLASWFEAMNVDRTETQTPSADNQSTEEPANLSVPLVDSISGSAPCQVGHSSLKGHPDSVARQASAGTVTTRRLKRTDTNSLLGTLSSFGGGSTADDTISVAAEVEMAPILDIAKPQRLPTIHCSIQQQYQALKEEQKNMKRIMLVELAEGVAFKPQQITKRLRGAMVQEIQVFSDARKAVVVFVAPSHAEQVMAHYLFMEFGAKYGRNPDKAKVDNSSPLTPQEVKAKAFRQTAFNAMQIKLSWYGKKNSLDAYRGIQRHLTTKILAEQATRVLRIGDIRWSIRREEVKQHLENRLMSLQIVHVRLEPSDRLAEIQLTNKTALIEFTNIADAIEARERLSGQRIFGDIMCKVAFDLDPCSEPWPMVSYCECSHCLTASEKRFEEHIKDIRYNSANRELSPTTIRSNLLNQRRPGAPSESDAESLFTTDTNTVRSYNTSITVLQNEHGT